MKGDGTPGGIVQDELAVIAGQVLCRPDRPGRRPRSRSRRGQPGLGDGAGRSADDRAARRAADYKTFPLAFTAGGFERRRRGSRSSSRGRESFRVGTVSLMPADNVEGLRADVLALLKELNSPVYRWPGGNFVSGYDWKDGLGDPDRRPPRKNPAWQGVEHNDVGIHEFMRFCELVGTDPYITVNSGQGNETLAADEVEYVNGPADSAMGRAAGQQRAPRALEGQVLVDRQRDVRRLAARPHAAGRLHPEAQPVRQRHVGQGSVDQAGRRRGGGRVERGHAGGVRRVHGLPERAFLRRLAARASRPRRPDAARDQADRRRPSRPTARRSRRSRARRSRSPWTNGTTGTVRTSTASWGRSISSRTPWASPPACTSISATATSFHGQLRPDRERHRGDQDLQDGRRSTRPAWCSSCTGIITARSRSA